MAGIKEMFSKGITTINLKTSNFVEENKIKTYISNLETAINESYHAIGRQLYEQWRTGNVEMESFLPLINDISNKYSEIDAQMKQIDALREEEKNILGRQNEVLEAQGNVEPQSGDVSGEMVFCSKCGTKNQAGSKFCMHCGNSLE